MPFYSPNLGYVYKTSCESNTEQEKEQIPKDLLENLSRLDLLQKSFYDSVSACPSCLSTIITLHNRCPKCRSHNVIKTSLTEHIPCGCIDQRNNYLDDQCPKCGEQLVEGKYRNMGRWYVCKDCNEKFENPEYDLVCRECNTSFTIKESVITEIPKFTINLSRLKEIRQNVASLEDIRLLLDQLGFSVEMPGFAIGQKSGMQHHFSLIAKKVTNGQEVVIALDHGVSEEEVQTSPLILYIYKTSEVNVDIPIFVAMPRLNSTAKKIAEGHKIMLIEGSTGDAQFIERIKKEIEDRINDKAPNRRPDEDNKDKKRSIFKFR
jgi:predicted RNA-binding Zn-ribbon protein involved in translation (DUF1610 family)